MARRDLNRSQLPIFWLLIVVGLLCTSYAVSVVYFGLPLGTRAIGCYTGYTVLKSSVGNQVARSPDIYA